MSILNGPRLNFWGGIRTDVSVPNNSPTIPQGEDDDGKPIGKPFFDIINSQVADEAQDCSDDKLNDLINAPSRKQEPPHQPYYTAGGWNHYGQHVVDMQNVQISSQGTPGNISTGGDLIGQPVYLLGSVDPVTGQGPFSGPMMVDLDPTGGTSTQIYIGGLQIGSTSAPQLLIHSDVVASSFDVAQRLLAGENDAPGSSVLSGTFQVTFPLSAIVSWNQSSPALKALIEAPDATGIVVRFVMFEMCPTLTTEQLNNDYAANQYTPNPSIGRVIGTLAPSFDGEPLICQAGRRLVNKDTAGAGYADLNPGGILSIDMVNLIPKASFRTDRTDITSPIDPNVDYGPVAIHADSTTLATLDPAKQLQDYYLYGGIVDLQLESSHIQPAKTNALTINAPNTVSDSQLTIVEEPYRLYSDQRNLYLDDYPDGATLELQVRHLGGPLPTNASISLRTTKTSGVYHESKYWDLLNFPDTLNVAAGQTSVQVKVTRKHDKAAQAGYSKLTYSIGTFSGFTNFRLYAWTDFGIPSGSTVTWEQVYPYVLRFHYLAFPAMSRYIPLNQPDAIMGARKVILERTSDRYKGTTLYMPVVRSMSPSQRDLLKAYLTGEPWNPPMSPPTTGPGAA